ncbi:MAG TPA: VWA domain-containing protein, partial [Candidatus Thermoplasmatota archaeon]|nr:VWA domain-containing protein [Candidatus Thermoplasmatota archaeon]
LGATRAEAGRAAVASSELVRLLEDAADPRRLPWWRRAAAFLRRLLRAIVAVLLAPLRWLLSALGVTRRAAVRPVGKTTLLGRLGTGGPGLAVPLEDALALSPQFRRAVRSRVRALGARERMRALWERMLGREDYASLVARLVEREVAEDRARRESAARQKEDEFAHRLEDILEAERRAAEGREEALRRVELQAEEDARRLDEMLREEPVRAAAREVGERLEEAGLVSRDARGELRATLRLVERFAEVFYAEASRRSRPTAGRAAGPYVDGTGNVVREPLRSSMDVSHMDTVATLVNARMRHPRVRHLYDDDVVVHREERETLDHVVIVFDRSGSMEEHGRLDAAKRAVLALHQAVRRGSRRNLVDIVAMDTHVARVDLVGVWDSSPRGFTNTGGALRLARELLRRSPGARGLVYLVTDGLPEAYTAPDGVDVAGHPDESMKYALTEARRLRLELGVEVVQILLEPKDPRYVQAAEKLRRELGGRVVALAPKDLAATLVGEFEASAATKVNTRTPRTP